MPLKIVRNTSKLRPLAWTLTVITAATHGLAMSQPAPAKQALPAKQSPLSTPVQPAERDEAVRLLLEQARYWQSRANPARASEAWQKLLTLRPGYPEALYGMASAEIELGKPAGAKPYIDQLRNIRPPSVFVARITQDMALAQKLPDIQRARQLMKDGKPDEAVAAYQAALGPAKPTGSIGLEYYRALGGTLDGADDARIGLERLVAESPGDRYLALALAQHLTYSDSTRREGITRLSAMTTNPTVSREAEASWRKALGWLGNVPSDIPYYREYLRKHPNDQAVRTSLAELEKGVADGAFQQIEPDPALERIERGMNALQGNKLAVAETNFEGALRSRPRHAGALGGLGLVRLRQQRFAEAVPLLEQATRYGKSSEVVQWSGALRSARYWSLMRQAEVARDAGDNAAVAALLAQASVIDPKEPSADLMLGALQTAQASYAEAAATYERVLSRRPTDASALRGLVEVLAQGGKPAEAEALIAGMTPAQQAAAGDLSSVRARLAAAKAQTAAASGDAVAARQALATAVREDPQDPWNRLALARLLLQSDRMLDAATVMDAQPALADDATPPTVAGVMHARALFDAERRDWPAVRAALQRIPAAQRTEPISILLRNASVQSDLTQAEEHQARGLVDAATALRISAAQAAEGAPELMLAIAVSAAKTGDPAAMKQAQLLYANAIAYPAANSGTVGLRMQYAAALYAANKDDALTPVFTQLAALELTPGQQRGLDGLRTASSLRQAEQLRLDGKLADAQTALAPALAGHPDDFRLVSAQARIFSAGNRHAQAMALYQRALATQPDNTDLLLAASNAALALDDNSQAAQWLERAMAIAPDDSHVLAAAGRFYRRNGQTERAEQLLAAAIAMDARRAGAQQTTKALAPARLPTQPQSSRAHAVPVMAPTRVSWLVAQANDTPEPWLRSAPAALTPQERTALQDELDGIRQERSPIINAGILVRSRKGEAGLSRLMDVQTPVEARWTSGEARLSLRVTPTSLNAGTPAALGSGSLFGSGPLASPAAPAQGEQDDHGIGVAVGYESNGMRADLGTTPIGFQYVNLVGGLAIQRNIDQAWSWSGEVSRRAVTDSVLSFAGARDATTGARWGGITATGGRAQLGWDQGNWGLYGFGALHAVRGHGVANNTRTEVGGGVYNHIWQTDNSRLTSGLNVSALSYDRNLRGFTLGNGGYFSPQRFVSVSVPLDWSERSGKFAWRMRGSVGVQDFTERSAPFFPVNASAQAAASASGIAAYPEQSRRAVAYNAGVAMEYNAAPQVFLGAQLAVDNSRDFRQLSAGAYLRVSFGPSRGLASFPVEPLRSPYGSQ